MIDAATIRAKEQAHALGHREDGAEATPTPPYSVADPAYKANIKNVKSLPKSRVVTRKKSVKNIFAISAEEDGNGDEDSDSEDDLEREE